TGEPVIIKHDTGFITYASMSKDGTLYYTVGSGTHSELHLVSLDPVRKMVTATPRRVADRRMESQGPGAWSADGKWLAYVAAAASERRALPIVAPRVSKLIVRAVDTGHEREFTLESLGMILCWGPGNDVVYTGRGNGPHMGFDLNRISAATGESTTIARYPVEHSVFSISRSSDGKALLIGLHDTVAPRKGLTPR